MNKFDNSDHGCCSFLTNLELAGRSYDLYACTVHQEVIARFGDEDYEYKSAPMGVAVVGPLAVAQAIWNES